MSLRKTLIELMPYFEVLCGSQADQFVSITNLFYSGLYSEGLKQISKAIRLEPNISNLYVNRALFLSKLGDDEQAIKDIERSLKINPRNYIAYFNLFSILSNLIQDEEALENLCCSLSCLYLIRGKLSKNLSDVESSISYAFNNHEAHVLKGLLLMQKQKYRESMKSFQNALNIDPSNQIIKSLRRVAAEKGHFAHELPAQNDHFEKNQDLKLKSSFKLIDGVDILAQIENKLAQFNQLYLDINDDAGTITQKVPKESILTPQSSQGRHSRNQEIKIIYDSGLSTPKRQSEVHPEPGNIYIKSSMIHETEKIQFHEGFQKSHFEEEHFISIIDHEEKVQKVEVCLLPQEEKTASAIQDEFSSVLNIEHHGQEGMQHFESVIQEPRNFERQLEEKVEEFQQSKPTEHYNLIYPIDDHMKLKINILNLEFIEKDEEFLSKLTDLYCILNYNGGKSKLKSKCKGCEGSFCSWNQEFEPVDLSESPSDMKIKLYNKKYKSFRDDFLGDLEVLITTADLLKLPLYSKAGVLLGNLLMHLQLVEVVPAPKAEEFNVVEEESL